MVKNVMKIKVLILFIIILGIVVFVHLKAPASSFPDVDMSEIASVSNPVTSPSGNYQIRIIQETSEGVECYRFSIYKLINGMSDDTAVYTSNTDFRLRDTLYILWDSDDRVWVYSGDLGTFYWERISGGNWQEKTYAENKIFVPLLLQKLKPGYFNQ